jgi:GT2 family glycosyltransferase
MRAPVIGHELNPHGLLSDEAGRDRHARAEARGKFLWVGGEKLYVKGVTYGAFEPDSAGEEYHDRDRIERDFELMAEAGMNSVRIPHTMPPVSLLDAADRHGLKVMVGLSAEQYAGYLADSKGAPDVAKLVRDKVRGVAGHPAILCYALGNEIQAPLTRWLGRRTVERYLERLHDAVKDADPGGIVTYVNYPTTEYLQLPFLDLVAFNVYLETPDRLEAYLMRLQNIAGDRPLLMSEVGLDALRNGEDAQAESLGRQIRQVFAAGCAGAFVFSWTDEWFRAGEPVDDWAFGLTRVDRTPKPALEAVSTAFDEVPFPADREWPSISAVVCTYNGSRTLRESLEGLLAVDYPELEVVVVDDGSTDESAAIARDVGVRVVGIANGGLANARNVGAASTSGEIIAFVDDDAVPDPHWARYLADTFMRTRYAAVGGPNVPPPGDGAVAACVARSPGGPIHVLLSDTDAEHLPGCNLAVRREAFDAVSGFDPRFNAAGDDVDFCWKLEESGHAIGFNPAAMVWHHRRRTVRAYWRQQRGYGRAEALLEQKWPERYNAAGHVAWGGRVYGNTFALLGFRRGRVYSGRAGSAPFQGMYTPTPGLVDSLARLPEWWLVIASLAALSALSALWSPLMLAIPFLALALLLPLADAAYSGWRAHFPEASEGRLRWLTAVLHVLQPVARLLGRLGEGLSPWRRRRHAGFALPVPSRSAVWSEDWRPPEDWLREIEHSVRESGLAVQVGGGFDRWDYEVRGGAFGGARSLFAAEDHGAGNQYLRFRVWPRPSKVALVAALALLGLAWAAASDSAPDAALILGLMGLLLLTGIAVGCGVATAAIRSAGRAARTQADGREIATLLHAEAHLAATEERG